MIRKFIVSTFMITLATSFIFYGLIPSTNILAIGGLFGISLSFLLAAALQKTISEIAVLEGRWVQSFRIIFSIAYAISLVLVLFIPSTTEEVYLAPLVISSSSWIRAIAGILLTSFFPGFAIISLVDRRRQQSVLSIAIGSYLLSVFVTILLSLLLIEAFDGFQKNALLVDVGFNCIIFVAYLFLTYGSTTYRIRETGKLRISKRTIFLAAWIIFLCAAVLSSIYLIYGTGIIGDQRRINGLGVRLQKGYPTSDGQMVPQVPWGFPTYLASVFTLSGLPSINAYNLMNFLNILPIISFFFMVWSIYKSDIWAGFSTMLAYAGSGFGWIYFVIVQQGATLNNALYSTWLKTYDLLTPPSFIIAGHPDIGSALILITLVGFPYLFYLVFSAEGRALKYRLAQIFVITFLIYLGSPESSLFILVIGIALPFKKDGAGIGFAMFTGLLSLYFFDSTSIARYYSIAPSFNVMNLSFNLLGLLITYIFMMICLTFLANHVESLKLAMVSFYTRLHRAKILWLVSIIISGLFFFSYIGGIITWISILPQYFILSDFVQGGIVPWFIYPIKFGVAWLLAVVLTLAIVVSHKTNTLKLLLPFYGVALFSIILGPAYLEYRLLKYLYLSASIIGGLALLSLTNWVEFKTEAKTPFLASLSNLFRQSVGPICVLILILMSIPSTALYLGAVTQSVNAGVESWFYPYSGGVSAIIGDRVPYSVSDYAALEYIAKNANPHQSYILQLPRGQDNSYSEVSEFTGNWLMQLNRPLPYFQLSTATAFFTIGHFIDAQFIYLNPQDNVTLSQDSTYSNSFLRSLLPYLPKAMNYNGSIVYSIPSFTGPSPISRLALSDDLSNLEIASFAYSNTNYTVLNGFQYRPTGLETEIVSIRDWQENLELMDWVRSGGHVVIWGLPQDTYPVFQVENGSIPQTIISNGDIKVSKDGLKTTARGTVVFDSWLNKQFSITGEIKVNTSLQSDNHAGIVFDYTNDFNYYYLFLRNSTMVLYKIQNGTGMEVWYSPLDKTKDFQSITITQNDNILQFQSNKNLVGSYEDSSPLLSGYIGYRWYNANAIFGNLTVTKPIFDSTVITNEIASNISSLGLQFNSIKVPSVNLSEIPFNFTPTSYYYFNGTKVSVASLSQTIGTGKIMYLNIPDNLALSTSISGRGATLFRIVNIELPASHPPELPLNGYQLNYATGNIGFKGNVTFETDFIQISETTVPNWVTTFKHVKVSAQKMLIIPTISSKYTQIEVFAPFKIEIPASEIASYFLNDGSFILDKANSSWVTLMYNGTSMSLPIIARLPNFSVNGSVEFINANLATDQAHVLVVGTPAVINGNTSFKLVVSDGELSLLSGFNCTSKTIILSNSK